MFNCLSQIQEINEQCTSVCELTLMTQTYTENTLPFTKNDR